jgi:cytochrome P450
MELAVNESLPPGLPLPRAVQTVVFWRWPFVYLERCRDHYGSRFTLHAVGHPPLLFLSDRNDLKALVSAPADVLHPGVGAATITPIVGEESFMVMDEDKHLYGRKAILPAFHAKLVHQHTEWVASIVQRHVESWPRDTPITLYPRLRALTLEVILRRIFTSCDAAPGGQLDALRDRLLAMLSVTASTILSAPLLSHDPRRPEWARFLRHRQEADELIYALIDEYRDTTTHPGDVLTMILAARNPDGSAASRQQVRDNVMSVILAGHETTASELAWAFQLLAHNPSVQGRLAEEIDRDTDEQYLTATVQEVLRHRPVFVFTIPRAVVQPVEIGGRTYDPPVRLLGCIYLLHHDPCVYPEPDRFCPERFLDAPPRPHLWLPWGGGRKRCPGLHLAMLEMKTVLRAVLSSTTVLPASKRMEHPRWRSVIVTPHAGSRVVLGPRGQRATRFGSGPADQSPGYRSTARRRAASQGLNHVRCSAEQSNR